MLKHPKSFNLALRTTEFNLRILIIFSSIIQMQREQIYSNIEASRVMENNSFLLRRISIEPTCPSVQVDFSPVPCPALPSPTSQLNHHLRHTFPTFNTDSSYFTPAFILQVDSERYVSHASSYFSLHQAKKEQLCTEKTELFVPKPSKLSHFCCICKTVFEDYLTHVNIPMHQQKLRNSIFNNCITELCGNYKKTKVEAKKRAFNKHRDICKTKKNRKQQKIKLDSLLNCNVVKLDCSEQAKTREIID